MRKWIISVCCVLLSATLAFGAVGERCYNNTVVVQINGGHGSGVLFTREDETFIWTAGHVAEYYMERNGTFREVIIKQDDKVAKARILRCGDSYVTHDLALLQIVEGDLKGDAQFYRAFNEVKLGQKIIHCGSPYDLVLNGNLLFYGNISHIGRIFSLPFIPIPREVDQCDVIAYPGCSGGPIFDAETGDILGIMSIGAGPGLTVIVPTRIIYEWAKSHDCLWAFDSEVPLPENIIPWRGDVLDRLIKERITLEIDKRWGERDEEVPLPENIIPWPSDTLIRLIRERIILEINKCWGKSDAETETNGDVQNRNGVEQDGSGSSCHGSEATDRIGPEKGNPDW